MNKEDKLFNSILRTTDLGGSQIEKVKAVSKNIQLIADLSYSDIAIYCRTRGGGTVVASAVQPNTSASVREEVITGKVFDRVPKAVEETFKKGKRVEYKIGEDKSGILKISAIPIKEGKQVVAVITSERRSPRDWRPSEMEQIYMSAAEDLIQMIEAGVDVGITFPTSKEVGDGLLRIDADGIVTYATPNAISIYRRLGVEASLIGQPIGRLGLDENPVLTALEDRKAVKKEIKERGLTVIKRAIPLIENDRLKGAISIISDITEVRAREQQLKIKEATIREIHHRVKNNLQTIASLLRLQSRRMSSPEAKEALLESVGRISSIAVVHETLSQSSKSLIDFREIAENITSMLKSSFVSPDKQIEIEIEGYSGDVASPVATSLSLILTELVQNALEHAFTGRKEGKIKIELQREDRHLLMKVVDNGVGLLEKTGSFCRHHLGLQIVQTLVTDELSGSWTMEDSSHGTTVTVDIPLPKRVAGNLEAELE